LLGVVALGELLAVGIGFLKQGKTRRTEGAADPVVICGPVDRFSPGSVTAFVQGKFYLARLDDGGFLALSRQCTHLGCTVPWVEKERHFACPCHGSAFDITGSVLNAPAPRALNLFPVTIENRTLKVDTSKTVKRGGFQKAQAAYPAEA
jgi:cytochrome b6-f complex iron-sulfur subunit